MGQVGQTLAQYYVSQHRPTLFSFKNNLYIGNKIKGRHFELSDYILGNNIHTNIHTYT